MINKNIIKLFDIISNIVLLLTFLAIIKGLMFLDQVITVKDLIVYSSVFLSGLALGITISYKLMVGITKSMKFIDISKKM